MRNYISYAIGIVLGVAILTCTGSSVYAIDPHENPDTAREAFSGISLFNYYSGVLDFVLNKNLDEVEGRLAKMPFANIPEKIGDSVDNFSASTTDITAKVISIDDNLVLLKRLVQQSRLEESLKITSSILDDISITNLLLDDAKNAVEETGQGLGVFSSSASAKLIQTYTEVQDKLDKIRELLNLYLMLLEDAVSAYLVETGIPQDIYSGLDLYLKEFLDSLVSPGYSLTQKVKFTDITLEVESDEAFVGDIVSFNGVLSSEGGPLGGRNVSILIDSGQYMTVKTDGRGYYSGTIQVPLKYIPQLKIQSLYFPQGNDLGRYLAALSPEIYMDLLFYVTELAVTVDDMAYPGTNTTVTGIFNYGQNPPAEERDVEIYLDDIPIGEINAGEMFSKMVQISPDIEIGEHSLVVSVEGKGRYAPVITEAVLEVSRIIPHIDITIPGLALIPGSVEFNGRVYSELGPLGNTPVTVDLGNLSLKLVTTPDGYFGSKIGTGFSFGIIGSQDLMVRVTPDEPWFSSFRTAKKILLLNLITIITAVIILAVAGVYLPGRIKRILTNVTYRRPRPLMPVIEPEQVPEYSGVAVLTPDEVKKEEKSPVEPRERIIHWYRIIIGIVQRISKSILQPQQTLREYVAGKSGIFGPAADYLMQFTVLVEKLLYSRYVPTAADVDNSERLFTELGNESKFQPGSNTGLLDNEEVETTDQIIESEAFHNVNTTEYEENPLFQNRRGKLSVWVIVLLIITIAYYAGIILFVLPLLAVSISFLPVIIINNPDTLTGSSTYEEELLD